MIKEKPPMFRVCSKCKREFTYLNTRVCHHPNVNKAYGNIICGYCCKKCKHSERKDTGLACTYKLGD